MLFYIVLSGFVNVKTKSVCIFATSFLFITAEINSIVVRDNVQ